jgi:glycosyltransferase involved in cell wall biosynthesis
MPDLPNVILATPTWSLNGPNIFSANLVRSLQTQKIPAHIVLTRPDWLDAKPLPKPPDIRFETLAVNRFMSFSARCEAMIRYLETHAPCIYIPNYDFGHSCVSPKLSDRIAIVGIVHSDDPQHYAHVARLGNYWNAVVAVSSAIAGETLQVQPALSPRLSVIPYGIASAVAFPERARTTRRWLRAIYAGRLDQPQKRVLDLPEIVKAAHELDVPLHLSIAGSGPAEAQLKERCETLGVGATIEFLGTLNSDALAKVLSEKDVFLITSAFEGLPIGVLEAMGQGCVPVVTDIRSGIRELVEDGVDGFCVTVGDSRAFARRLSALFCDPAKLRQMAEAAYARAASGRYRLDQMVRSYIELFEEITAETFHRPAGRILAPPDLQWQEHLPGPLQGCGHAVKRLLGNRRP